MESRYGILIAVAILAFAVLLPMADADAGDSGYFSYKTQLDENGLLVYKEVANATTVNDPSKEFTVEFSNLMFYGYETEEKAKAYANHTVQNALAAAYYSNPMVAYLWDYPVKQIEVNTTVEKVDVTSDTGTNTYYRAVKVTFTLTVPEGITSDSMKELDEAIRIQETLSDAWLVKTQAYSEDGRYEEAAASLEKYIELTGDFSTYERLSQLFAEIGETEKTIELTGDFKQI